jgi:hypothetical protein
MKLTKKFLICVLLLTGLGVGPIAAIAMPVTGVVTNKTTGKPSDGDRVTLVDPSQGMADIDKATTDSTGHYTLNTQGPGQFLIRVDHQGASYFAPVPPSGAPVNIAVYDIAEKVDGISLDANVMEIETDNGQLTVDQRYYVKNASSPPRAMMSKNTFEFALPDGAVLDTAAAQRPVGLPTTTEPQKLNQKNHYTINSVPIEPSQGTKETMFEIRYHLPYSGKFTLTSKQITIADNIIVFLPKQITFKPDADAAYQSIQQNPSVQTFVIKGAKAGQSVGFSISGTGQMPREQQGKVGPGMGGGEAAGAEGGASGAPAKAAPGGGIGNPNSEDDVLSKYKWWIIIGLALILVVAAAFLLRRQPAGKKLEEDEEEKEARPEPEITAHTSTDWSTPSEMAPATSVVPSYSERVVTPPFQSAIPQPVAQHAVTSSASLLHTLKDELFSIETDKLNGLMDDTEYAEAKFAIDVLLKRALRKG